jgi:chromate transporter
MQKTNLKTLCELFWVFFKAGTFTFAGGLAMLPVIQKDVVDKRRWMTKEEFVEYATLAQSLPGVIALNCACFIGRRAAGLIGMIVAGIGATISAFFLMLVATVLLNFIPREGAFAGAFQGVRAASAALVLSAAFMLGRGNLKTAFAVILMLCAFGLIAFTSVSAPLVVLVAGAAGYIYQRLKEREGAK